MSRGYGNTLVITLDEVALLMAIVGGLDAKDYKRDAAKALIHKCKSQIENPSDRLRIVSD